MDRAERAETVDECTCRLPSCIAVCTASLTRERCSTPASLMRPTTFFMGRRLSSAHTPLKPRSPPAWPATVYRPSSESVLLAVKFERDAEKPLHQRVLVMRMCMHMHM